MKLPLEPATRLRIYIGEGDRIEKKPAYEWLVLKAREERLAGATALRGPLGYGERCVVRSAKILQLSTDLPFVIEIVDATAKVEAFLEKIEPRMPGGYVTVEEVRAKHFDEPA